MDQSPFQKLSAELRNRIYEFALVSNRPLRITGPEPNAVQPAITRVCKQMRDENLLLFYNSNTFKIAADNMTTAEDVDDQLSSAYGWLKNTTTECHGSVASLMLELILEWREPGVPCIRDYKYLSRLLRKAGYRSPRLRVEIDMNSYELNIEGLGGRVGVRKMFRKMFKDVKLDVTIRSWGW